MDKKIKEFCYKYEARAEPSHRVHRRAKRIDYKIWSDSDPDMFQTIPYEDVPMVSITMPEDRFRALLEHDQWIEQAGLQDNRHFNNNVMRVSQMVVDHERECKIRNQYPALRILWDKYQTMLRLCDSGH
jgi:hypothetical protein